MTKHKFRALGVAAIGLTGHALALAAGIAKVYAPAGAVNDSVLTWCFLIGIVFGAVFIAIGMTSYDRLCQQEQDDQLHKPRGLRKGVRA